MEENIITTEQPAQEQPKKADTYLGAMQDAKSIIDSKDAEIEALTIELGRAKLQTAPKPKEQVKAFDPDSRLPMDAPLYDVYKRMVEQSDYELDNNLPISVGQHNLPLVQKLKNIFKEAKGDRKAFFAILDSCLVEGFPNKQNI